MDTRTNSSASSLSLSQPPQTLMVQVPAASDLEGFSLPVGTVVPSTPHQRDIPFNKEANVTTSYIESNTLSVGEGSLKVAPDERWRIALSFFITAQVGMSDASLGAQLNTIQGHYHLSYTVVSFIFLVNVAGWLISCPLNPFLLHRIGLRNTLLAAGACNAIGALIISFAPPFYGVIVALVFTGIGAGINDASLSTYTACLSNEALLTLLYSSLGVGALISPLIVAGILENGVAWNYYYYVPLGLAVMGAVPIWIAFRDYTAPKDQGELGENVLKTYTKTAFSPRVLLGGLLVLLSLTATEILSSWIVSFMTSIRHGQEVSMRYVLSGLWAGQTVGRIILAYPTPIIGERVSLSFYLIICFGLLSVVQFVPSIPGDAVAVALFGLFMGPVTPTIITVITKTLPKSLVSPAVSSITCIGLVGSAIGPLVVGFINEAGGLPYLAAIVMGIVGLLLILWQLGAPRRSKSTGKLSTDC